MEYILCVYNLFKNSNMLVIFVFWIKDSYSNWFNECDYNYFIV